MIQCDPGLFFVEIGEGGGGGGGGGGLAANRSPTLDAPPSTYIVLWAGADVHSTCEPHARLHVLHVWPVSGSTRCCLVESGVLGG